MNASKFFDLYEDLSAEVQDFIYHNYSVISTINRYNTLINKCNRLIKVCNKVKNINNEAAKNTLEQWKKRLNKKLEEVANKNMPNLNR